MERVMEDSKLHYGKVIWFDNKKGFGFISWKDDKGVEQKDLFVHFSDISCQGFKTLSKDDFVTFNIGKNFHGDPKATNVALNN
jgi:CspA family cold shock protein